MLRLFKKDAKKDSNCCNIQIEEVKESEMQTSETSVNNEKSQVVLR